MVETPYGAQEYVATFKEEHVQWDFQNGGTGRDGMEVSGPFELHKESISHNEAFARAPAKSDERDGAQIETRRHKV